MTPPRETITTTSTTTATATPSSAEQRLRDAEVARLKASAAQTADPEHHRYLTQRAAQVAKAVPICCYVEQLRHLHEREHGASHRIEYDSDGQAVSEAGIYRDMRRERAEEHVYASGLVSEVGAAFVAKSASDAAQAIVKHHRAHHG